MRSNPFQKKRGSSVRVLPARRNPSQGKRGSSVKNLCFFLRFFAFPSNPLRRSGLRVSKSEGKVRFLHARICPDETFCFIHNASWRLSWEVPKNRPDDYVCFLESFIRNGENSIRYMFHCGFFFVSPEARGFVRALGNFCRLRPVAWL